MSFGTTIRSPRQRLRPFRVAPRLVRLGVLAGLLTAMLSAAPAHAGDLVALVENIHNITTESFPSTDASVVTGCITAGTHRVMRFDVVTRNMGNTAFVPGPMPPPACSSCPCSDSPVIGAWVWSNFTCQWHITSFVTYSISNAADVPISSGFQHISCLRDSRAWSTSAPRRKYACAGPQGVSSGFDSIDDSTLPCQFANMDGVTNGNYRLVTTTNKSRLVAEDQLANDSTAIPFNVNGNTVTLIQGAWQPRQTRTATVGPTPAVASWGPHRMDVFWVHGTLGHAWKENNAWGAAEELGSPSGVSLGTTPSVVSWGTNRLDIFAEGSDHRLWHTYWDNGWGGWDNPAGVADVALHAVPTAVSWAPNRLDIFYLNSSGTLGHVYWSSGWFMDDQGTPAGSGLSTMPAAVASNINRLDVFDTAVDGRMWHKAWTGSNWTSWVNPQGITDAGGRPGVASWGPGRVDAFWVAQSSGEVHHVSLSGTTWGPWETIGGPPGGVFMQWTAATAWGPDHLDVFARAGNQMWHRGYDNGWAAWEAPYSNTDLALPPVAVTWARNQVQVIMGLPSGPFASAMLF